jgi:hypothetical protein
MNQSRSRGTGLAFGESDIDAALDWGNGKLYLFKGSEYVRYDIAADKADDGYPQRIEASWTRLWSEGYRRRGLTGEMARLTFFAETNTSLTIIAADAVDSGYPRKIAGGCPPSTSMATTTPRPAQCRKTRTCSTSSISGCLRRLTRP